MTVVYLVIDYDWESSVVVGASLSAETANRLRREYDAKTSLTRPRGPHSIWSIEVEEQELTE